MSTPLTVPKSTLDSKKVGKKIPAIFCLITLFMNSYSPDFYKEILECYDYETRNPTIYGNVIRGEMRFYQKLREKLRIDGKGDENHF